MKIQLNTDTNVEGSLALSEETEVVVARALTRFEDRLTRVEVHLGNESARRTTGEDFRCLVEARPAGLEPVTATKHAATLDEALDGALDKLVTLLSSKFDRLENQGSRETIRGH
jgi:ribosome-associated translation inhibitor RaiA